MPQYSIWSDPPKSLSLPGGEVHVWRVSLEQPGDVLEHLQRTLEQYEVDRANRFHFERHRRHFVVGRGFLRHVLAQYLETKPEALRFSYGTYGKPVLTGEQHLRFNMSHTHEIAVLAVSRDAELGVDVEHIRADFASEDIALRFFSRVEVEAFTALQKNEQIAAFFRCWTRKEAYIKAIGKGLSQALDRFDVTLGPGEPPALLRADEEDPARWFLTDIDAGPDYAAALAVEAPVSEVKLWQGILQDLRD